MASKSDLPPVPAALSDVALIDGPTSAATGGVSLSTWHSEVKEGRAPQPVIRSTRFTRWRLIDVRDYWKERASRHQAEAAAQVTAQARKASEKASQIRAARAEDSRSGK